jgi:hypothetical protein
LPDIGATIRTLTLADGTVSGLVSTRMHSDVLPQRASLPAITYSVVDTLPNEHLAGIAALSRARIQIDCYAATRAAANSLADAVRLALATHRGTTSGQRISSITMPSGEAYSFDPVEAGSDQRRFVTSMDFYVFYQTTTS